MSRHGHRNTFLKETSSSPNILRTMSFAGFNNVGDDRADEDSFGDDAPRKSSIKDDRGDNDEPFLDGPDEDSLTTPLKPRKGRNSIIGAQRVASFGQQRNRTPSTSVSINFAMGISRVASMSGRTSPIVENDAMDVDPASPKTPVRPSSNRTPLEPIMNDLQIVDRVIGSARPCTPIFGESSAATACSPSVSGELSAVSARPPPAFGGSSSFSARPGRAQRAANTQVENGSLGYSNMGSPRPKGRSLRASFDDGQTRPTMPQLSFGSFQSEASSHQSDIGDRQSFDMNRDSMRSVMTGYTSPSPFGSISSIGSVLPPGSAVPTWTPAEDRFLLDCYEKYKSCGSYAPFSVSATRPPPYQATKIVRKQAIAFWNIYNNQPAKHQLELWVGPPCEGTMKWIETGSKWLHDKVSTQKRINQIAQGIVQPSSTSELENMFSSSDAKSLSLGGSIPLRAIAVASPSSRDRPSDSLSMPPPPLPLTASRNIEMQIGTRLRTSVEASSLPSSYRAPGASAAVLGRAVKSLGRASGGVASQSSMVGASIGHSRQSQSLSAATGSRALDAALSFGPPLSSVKGKKRNRDEDSADAEFAQRQNRARGHTFSSAPLADESLRNLSSFRPRGLNFAAEPNVGDGNNHEPCVNPSATFSATNSGDGNSLEPRVNLSATFHEMARETARRDRETVWTPELRRAEAKYRSPRRELALETIRALGDEPLPGVGPSEMHHLLDMDLVEENNEVEMYCRGLRRRAEIQEHHLRQRIRSQTPAENRAALQAVNADNISRLDEEVARREQSNLPSTHGDSFDGTRML